jgi:hypothetical protein
MDAITKRDIALAREIEEKLKGNKQKRAVKMDEPISNYIRSCYSMFSQHFAEQYFIFGII